MRFCIYQERSGSFCGKRIAPDDLDAVELERGAGVLCGKHVDALLNAPVESELDTIGRLVERKRKAVMKSDYCPNFSTVRVRKI